MTLRSLVPPLLLLLLGTVLVCVTSESTTDAGITTNTEPTEDPSTEVVTPGTEPPSTTETADIKDDCELQRAMVQSSNRFALNLYKFVGHQVDSILLSPLSIGAMLSMLWLGAAEKTAMQIAKALNLPEKRADVTMGFHDLFKSLKVTRSDNITLSMASKLYAHNTFDLNEDFHSTIKNSFLADAELLNFVADPDVARTSINHWVEQQTHSHIKELLQKGTVNVDTKVVIVNAVYFKGLWKNPFIKQSTRNMPFELLNGTTVLVPTMLAIGEFPTASIRHLNCSVIQMPYEGSVSLLVLLPQSRQGLPDLEEQLTLQDIDNTIPLLEDIELHLSFPKFKLEFSKELEDAFKKLGIEAMFGTEANLSGISPVKGLSVTHIMHKSSLEVTEEGSEASAATGTSLDIRGGTLSMMIDHPFMFVIRDDNTGAILFLGNYKGPH